MFLWNHYGVWLLAGGGLTTPEWFGQLNWMGGLGWSCGSYQYLFRYCDANERLVHMEVPEQRIFLFPNFPAKTHLERTLEILSYLWITNWNTKLFLSWLDIGQKIQFLPFELFVILCSSFSTSFLLVCLCLMKSCSKKKLIVNTLTTRSRF